MKPVLAWCILVFSLTVAAQAQNSPRNAADAKSPASTTQASTANSDIAAAKAAGKVWVNLDTRVYHKSGRWYGKTKNGKFMTEAEAKAGGNKPAKKE